jgi:hypothetical protein
LFFNRYNVPLILTVFFFCNNVGYAQSAGDPIRDAVIAELGNRHPENPKQVWQSLGEPAVPVLIERMDQAKSSYERMRAIEGLGVIGGANAEAAIERAEKKWGDHRVLRRQIAESTIDAKSASDPTVFSRFINDPDPKLRESVWKKLLKNYPDHSWVRTKLEESTKAENSDWVRKTLIKAKKEIDDLDQSRIGEWKGFWVSQSMIQNLNHQKTVAASIQLKWQRGQWLADGYGQRDVQIQFRQTATSDWMHLVDLKSDKIFIAQRVLKKTPASIKPLNHGDGIR